MSSQKSQVSLMYRKAILYKIVVSILLFIVGIVQLFPFYLKLVESFQPLDMLTTGGIIYLKPLSFNLSNYALAWEESNLLVGYINSLIVTITYLFFSSIIVLVMGYVFAIKKFHGKNIVFMIFLSAMMIPTEITLIPNYEMVITLGLDASLACLILPGLVNVFGVFLVRQFLLSMPISLFESAKIDGAGEFRTIFMIVLPLSLSVLSTYIIMTFVSVWNDYLWPYIALSDDKLFTVQLKLMMYNSLTGTARDGILKSAGMMIVTVPIVIVYLIFQKQFVEGISVTGLK